MVKTKKGKHGKKRIKREECKNIWMEEEKRRGEEDEGTGGMTKQKESGVFACFHK